MTSRIVAVIAVISLGSATAASLSGAAKPNDWRTYELLDVRNPGSPVALIEYAHHRVRGDAVVIRTHLLLRSGSHWRDATPRALRWQIEDAYFADRLHGWLVTNDCAAGKGAMYRTRNGGRTWRRLPWGFTHGCAAGSGFRLTFVDRNDGWVIHPEPTAPGGSIYRTRDGGKTWTYHPTSPDGFPVLDAAVFTTPSRGWAIGLSWLYAGPLYKTSNSGRTWRPERELPRARYSVPVTFGRNSLVMGTRRGVATFYRTADSGRRWTAVDRLDVHGLRFPDFKASAKHTWWVFGMRGSAPVVLVTTNSGRTWTQSSPGGRAHYAGLEVANARAWLSTNPLEGEGALLTSDDLGRTWTHAGPRTGS